MQTKARRLEEENYATQAARVTILRQAIEGYDPLNTKATEADLQRATEKRDELARKLWGVTG